MIPIFADNLRKQVKYQKLDTKFKKRIQSKVALKKKMVLCTIYFVS